MSSTSGDAKQWPLSRTVHTKGTRKRDSGARAVPAHRTSNLEVASQSLWPAGDSAALPDRQETRSSIRFLRSPRTDGPPQARHIPVQGHVSPERAGSFRPSQGRPASTFSLAIIVIGRNEPERVGRFRSQYPDSGPARRKITKFRRFRAFGTSAASRLVVRS
jgi:hypothetical protein